MDISFPHISFPHRKQQQRENRKEIEAIKIQGLLPVKRFFQTVYISQRLHDLGTHYANV